MKVAGIAMDLAEALRAAAMKFAGKISVGVNPPLVSFTEHTVEISLEVSVGASMEKLCVVFMLAPSVWD